MKIFLAILIAFSVLQITPALAGVNKTNSALTSDLKSAIKSVETAKGPQSDIQKLKKIKTDFGTAVEEAWKTPRYKFYEYALEQYKSINKVLERNKLPTLTPPDWL